MYSESEENVDTEHMIKMFTDKNFFSAKIWDFAVEFLLVVTTSNVQIFGELLDTGLIQKSLHCMLIDI